MKDWIQYMLIDLIINNKEWLFSGIGVLVIPYILTLLIKKNKTELKDVKIEQNIINIKNDHVASEKESRFMQADEFKLYETVDRFIEIYEAHGVKANQIYKFVDKKFSLKLSDFKNKDTLLEVISEELLDYTADIFRINKSWLDGNSEYVYQTKSYYKEVHSFIRLIGELYNIYRNSFNIYLFKSGELNPKLSTGSSGNHIVILIQIPIKKINDKSIYSYIPVRDLWDWGYWKTRYQLKSIIWFCVKLSISIPNGSDLDTKTAESVAAGLLLPNKYISNDYCKCTWNPEDYSGNAGPFMNLEEDEIPQLKQYIKEQKYDETYKSIMN